MDAQYRGKVCLQRRDLWRINHVKPGSSLSCDAGVLWVTQTGDSADYILLPGDTVTMTHRGRVLVEAMRDAAFHVA
jgi:hypothetical protein